MDPSERLYRTPHCNTESVETESTHPAHSTPPPTDTGSVVASEKPTQDEFDEKQTHHKPTTETALAPRAEAIEDEAPQQTAGPTIRVSEVSELDIKVIQLSNLIERETKSDPMTYPGPREQVKDDSYPSIPPPALLQDEGSERPGVSMLLQDDSRLEPTKVVLSTTRAASSGLKVGVVDVKKEQPGEKVNFNVVRRLNLYNSDQSQTVLNMNKMSNNINMEASPPDVLFKGSRISFSHCFFLSLGVYVYLFLSTLYESLIRAVYMCTKHLLHTLSVVCSGLIFRCSNPSCKRCSAISSAKWRSVLSRNASRNPSQASSRRTSPSQTPTSISSRSLKNTPVKGSR